MNYTNLDPLPLSLTVDTLAKVLCIGKNKAYDLVRCKAIRSVRIGKLYQNTFEYLYLVTLFSGMGKGEVLGLTWNCINFQKNMITIDKQLQKERRGNGDDIKTLQENLGHHTAAFTLESYAHATAQMKTENADRMERFIHNLGA